MIRSDVGVTMPVLLPRVSVCVAEAERPVLTTCFEPLLTKRDAFCFFVMG